MGMQVTVPAPALATLGQAAPASSAPFTLKQVTAGNDFHIVTADGLKITAQQAAQIPIDNRAIAVTGATPAVITLPDGREISIQPNSRMALDERVYQASAPAAPEDATPRVCTMCSDGLRRNVSIHVGSPRQLRTYVDQAIAGYANCKIKATGDCTTGDILVRTLQGACDSFSEEDPYRACIQKSLGP